MVGRNNQAIMILIDFLPSCFAGLSVRFRGWLPFDFGGWNSLTFFASGGATKVKLFFSGASSSFQCLYVSTVTILPASPERVLAIFSTKGLPSAATQISQSNSGWVILR